MKRGDRVTVTGIGRTAQWGTCEGTVQRVGRRRITGRGTAVFVRWDHCSFSDQMSEDEVQLMVHKGDK